MAFTRTSLVSASTVPAPRISEIFPAKNMREVYRYLGGEGRGINILFWQCSWHMKLGLADSQAGILPSWLSEERAMGCSAAPKHDMYCLSLNSDLEAGRSAIILPSIYWSRNSGQGICLTFCQGHIGGKWLSRDNSPRVLLLIIWLPTLMPLLTL